jgi:TolB-like protein
MISLFLCFLFTPILLFSQTESAKPRIAVLPVDMVLTEEANSRQVVDRLTHEMALELAKRVRYDVLPPVQTKSVKDTIMNSDERWRHAGMQPNDIQLVGTALGAGYVIAGSLTRTGDKYLYHAWFYKTDGGKVLASNFIEYRDMTEGLTLARLLAGWLLNDAEPLEAPVPNTAMGGTSSSYTTAPTPGATLSTTQSPAQPSSQASTGTAGTALPWASIITMPTATGLSGGGVQPSVPVSVPSATSVPATTPASSQPLVSASADSPTSVVINIAPGPEAVAAPAPAAAAAPLVFNNNNNNNNNLGGGGGQQQQQQSAASPPLFILMPQEKQPEPPAPEPPAPEPPAPVPEPPPPERIVETETVEVEVPVTTRQLLYAGVRGGIQLRQYTVTEAADEVDPIPYTTTNARSTGTFEYEGAVFFGIQILPFIALQADVMWTSNDITASDDEGPTARYQTMFGPLNLMIGAQLKFTFWLGTRILLAPFGAFYYSMMLGGMNYTHIDTATADTDTPPTQVAAGVINVGGGLTFGVKLGPGELFAEGKVLFDMSPTQLTVAGDDGGTVSWNAYTRSILPSITLGYQLRFLNLKRRAEPEPK